MKQISYSILLLILGVILVYGGAPMDLLGVIVIFYSPFLFIQGVHKTEKS